MNKMRTFWSWKPSKNKNIEPHQNFSGFFIKKCVMKNKYLTLGDKCFTYYTSRSIHWMCSKKKELLKILQNSKGNTYFRESFFNKVAGLKGYNFILKKLEHRCFPVNFARFSRTTSLQNTFKLLHCTKNEIFH